MKRIAIIFLVAGAAFNFSCKKDQKLVKEYTATLDMRPSTNNTSGVPVAMDSSKNIFLNLADGIVYNIKNAKANASLVDLIVYDGSTNATAIGNVHFVSPEGNSLSMKQMASVYKYLKPGTTNEGVQFYTLTGMDT